VTALRRVPEVCILYTDRPENLKALFKNINLYDSVGIDSTLVINRSVTIIVTDRLFLFSRLVTWIVIEPTTL
jgi:hypothetical protein